MTGPKSISAPPARVDPSRSDLIVLAACKDTKMTLEGLLIRHHAL